MKLVADLLVTLGLGFFFGLAFEEFHHDDTRTRPGGIRTFPLLALCGALLFWLPSGSPLPFCVGLLVLGGWLALFYAARLQGDGDNGIVVLVCNLLAYLLGAVVMAGPRWVAVGGTVGAVLLLTGRDRLHALARRVGLDEIVTAGKFLILTGLVMPLLPDTPVTRLTHLTPHQVWLAVLAICTVSYASYLLQRYVAPKGTGVWVALLGGLYSSTATTIVLARRLGDAAPDPYQTQAGIVLATAIMYLRLTAIVGVFDWSLALHLAPPAIGLAACGGLIAAILYRRGARAPAAVQTAPQGPSNPLELTTALVFAALFVVISVATGWARDRFGVAGLYALAAVVGVSDIDPFVLSLAEGGAPGTPVAAAVLAILIAASSNNVLKAAYTLGFAGRRHGALPAGILVLLAMAGLGVTAMLGGWI
ncbi:MgtC/SapB family protein [Gluconacetobacter azotocaptans]|uniref:MgtC/SapB family protein n=1 Tax=Gluconacetobacter azotocaptans TaxID=142834 RepID=A0A7W4JPU6_9PROT|nr:MgtC/SapB family protein [Gluconacetobacter azotocaptans]MBB2188672.1 MgtC/SapB family protein [Gluconacetobacter azotocaptans]MBM9400435.1 MgtC/SapB family protein [Gluconacetobacter azotocaptans]GBQ35148.1 hypothetical protein AA13594_3042 [Gluconacetobacter azotocaptans DSM 13594]